jgi:iron uptake system component EfeO
MGVLPTFVIGLREGLEASLIVGIVAAFLARNGRRDALRFMWVGVATAVVVCAGAAVGLQVLSADLPQQQQEGLETVIGAVAVATVTYMVFWMGSHAREMKSRLEGAAADSLARGSSVALVAMACLAVLREGFETSVFLLAAFQASTARWAAGVGALLGILVAVGIGIGIYRGGIRINMARFFRVTAFVLVLVAAGLVMSALHTAHEAGWLNVGQTQALNLSGVARPGTVLAALLTGVLGIQPFPTTIEVAGWLLYAIPMVVYVLRPRRTSGGGRAGHRAPAVIPARAVDGPQGTATARAVRAARGVGAATLALFLVGCGSGGPAPAGGDAQTVRVVLHPDGCEPSPASVPTGSTTFEVRNDDASAVSEAELQQGGKILGEKENLTPGLSGSFTLRLDPGTYQMFCPGAATDTWTFTVSGSGAAGSEQSASPAAAAAVSGYHRYVVDQVDELVPATAAFAGAVRDGDLDMAKRLFARARAPYERIEPVAESFGDLDPEIDARIDDVENPADWTGFHRIEKALWVDGSLAGMTPIADKLVTDVGKLQRLVDSATYQPAQMANGATELLDEVATSKVTGEEDRYSHTDLSDFEANVAGARAAFHLLQPMLRGTDPGLATTIEARFEALLAALAVHRSDPGYQDSGFVDYSTVTEPQRRALSQSVDALAEPLSQVAAKVA